MMLDGMVFTQSNYLLSLWRVIFAVAAIADIASCWPIVWRAWEAEDGRLLVHREGECATTPFRYRSGMIFCMLCVIEAVVRAAQAHRIAIENSLLVKVENSLSKAYRYSATRMSFQKWHMSPETDVGEMIETDRRSRSLIRMWAISVPVGSTLSFWLLLLPPDLDFRCGHDSTFASTILAYSISYCQEISLVVQNYASSVLWQWVMPYKLTQPRLFYRQIRRILRAIRFVRFAGPLFRLCLKVGDQLWALNKAWTQEKMAGMEKAERCERRSLLWTDLQRVASLGKVETALASLPSQMFAAAPEVLRLHHQRGRELTQQLRQLQRDISREISTSVLFDRLVRMQQHLKRRYYDSFLESHELISPLSRFSVIWRVTVTCCLLLELGRLMGSWWISPRSFHLSLTQLLQRVLTDCNVPAHPGRRVKRAFRRLANALPFLPNPPIQDALICAASSAPSVRILQEVGPVLESFIDIVSFLDIFIWFNTGELDRSGVVVPKPFFSRCILPGTLVQILDHPTLPAVLPSLLEQLWDVATAVGWSRALRWVLAIAPAIWFLFLEPLKNFALRPDTSFSFQQNTTSYTGLLPSEQIDYLLLTSVSDNDDEQHLDHDQMPLSY